MMKTVFEHPTGMQLHGKGRGSYLFLELGDSTSHRLLEPGLSKHFGKTSLVNRGRFSLRFA